MCDQMKNPNLFPRPSPESMTITSPNTPARTPEMPRFSLRIQDPTSDTTPDQYPPSWMKNEGFGGVPEPGAAPAPDSGSPPPIQEVR